MQATNFLRMRLIKILISINQKSFLFNGSEVLINARSCVSYMLGPSFTTFKPSQALYFRCYSSLKKDEESSQPFQKTSKKHQSPKILVLSENGKETAMYLHEAERYAKHNNLKLIKLENNTNAKQKYKFQKVSELFQEKNKNTSNKEKKFFVKDVITEHDFKTKINSMLKYVEKGQRVVCVIDAVDLKNKLDEKLSIINNSKLKEYIIQNVKSSKKLTLYFKQELSQMDKSKNEKVDVENRS